MSSEQVLVALSVTPLIRFLSKGTAYNPISWNPAHTEPTPLQSSTQWTSLLMEANWGLSRAPRTVHPKIVNVMVDAMLRRRSASTI